MSTVRKIDPKGTPVKVERGKMMEPFTRSMEEFFESFPRRWMESFMEPFGWRRPMWKEFEGFMEFGYPPIDLIDHEDELLIRAELPGVRKEDLEITIVDDRLTIKAKRELRKEDKGESFYRAEMGYGTLMRTVRLPVDVDLEKAKSELKDGMLQIWLPKLEIHKRHKIKVA